MPFPTIQTERLLLRIIVLADAPALAKRRSEPVDAKYQSWSVPYSLQQATALITKTMEIGGIDVG